MPAQKSTLTTNPSEVTLVPPPAKDLLTWTAPARPFKKRDREYFTTIAAIVLLLAIILLFIKEWLLIGVIIALMFVSYVLGTVPPPNVNYKITSRGIMIEDKTYNWSQLRRFWFTKKWGNELIYLETLLPFPRQLQLIMESQNKEAIKKIVEKYILFEEPKKNVIDKAATWLEEKVPLEAK